MRFGDRQKAIRKEKAYAEKRFTQLLARVDEIDDPFDEVIEKELLKLDQQWRDFCKNLIYLKKGGEDEFMKVAHERAYPATKVEA